MAQKKSSFKRIVALGEARVAKINAMLMGGSSAEDIANLIQQDWKEFLDVEHASLRRQVTRYKNELTAQEKLAKDLTTPVRDEPIMDFIPADLTRHEVKCHVLDQLSVLQDLQMKRIRMAMDKESTVGMLFQFLTRDIEVQERLLLNIAKHQFELGLLKYMGPVVQQGRMVSTTTTAPDGTTTTTQVAEAVQSAMQVLETFEAQQ